MAKLNPALALILGLIGGALLGRLRYDSDPAAPAVAMVSDTTRVIITDTIKYPLPIPRDSLVVRYITERLPLAPDSAPDINVASKTENTPDSAQVIVPITSVHYHADEYDAWVSGHHPSLDSIHVYPRHETLTITKTTPPKRWGLSVGAGFAATPRAGLQPALFVGATYTFLTF